METTARGFKVYGTLTDSYGSSVEVQESSVCGRPQAWIFAHNDEIENPSPHLTADNARQLIAILQAFIADAENPANWRNQPEYKEGFG